MSLDLTDDKSTLVQVMAWCRQATSHHLSQYWHLCRNRASLGPNEFNHPLVFSTHLCHALSANRSFSSISKVRTRTCVSISNVLHQIQLDFYQPWSISYISYTVECRYNAVQYINILHISFQELRQNINQGLNQQPMNVALTGELWGAFRGYFWKKLTAL